MIKYEKPEFKISRFETEDILTESSIGEDGLASATIYGGKAYWNNEWDLTDIQ